MTERTQLDNRLDGLIDIGTIDDTASSDGSTITASIIGAAPESTEDAETDDVERSENVDLWGDAAVLMRPADPDATGACEVMFVRRGDTREVIATKDRRWQLALEKGEVVVRNMVADEEKQITLKLAQDGTLTIVAKKTVISSDDIRLTGALASDAVALASKVDQRNDKVAQALDAFAAAVPVPNDGGAAIHTAFTTVWGAPPTAPSNVGSTKVKTD